MADSQARLSMTAGDSVSRCTGLLVIGAVVGLVLLKRLSVSVGIG